MRKKDREKLIAGLAVGSVAAAAFYVSQAGAAPPSPGLTTGYWETVRAGVYSYTKVTGYVTNPPPGYSIHVQVYPSPSHNPSVIFLLWITPAEFANLP